MYKLLLLFLYGSLYSFGQVPRYNAALLDTLTVISNDTTISKHFATLYYKAIEITNAYAHTQPTNVQQFIFEFEKKFGPYFFAAHNNYTQHTSVPLVWRTYYTHQKGSALQYQFIGMNAHINGDMWKALANIYPVDTLQHYKKELLQFQKAFNQFFDSIYTTTFTYKKVKKIHRLTLGLDRVIGRKMVYHWRKRQVNLAIWYTTQPKKWQRRMVKLAVKIKRWDRFAVRWLQ